MARDRAVARHQAAEVDDPPHAGGARGGGEALGGAPLVLGNAAVGRPFHRVDQVVGGVDAVERAGETGAADRVADDDVVERDAGGRDALRRAGEAADLVARSCRRGTSAAPT